MSYDQSLLKSASEAHLGESVTVNSRTIATLPSKFFLFECIMKEDKTIVIHLKNLIPAFRYPKMMTYLSKWLGDRIGAHGKLYADFIGTINRNDGKGAITLNSLDIFIEEYLPAQLHDERFIHRHFSDLASKLIEELNCKY